jgi:hypothetical protein
MWGDHWIEYISYGNALTKFNFVRRSYKKKICAKELKNLLIL